MKQKIPNGIYHLILIGLFALLYLQKLDIDIEFLGNTAKFISK